MTGPSRNHKEIYHRYSVALARKRHIEDEIKLKTHMAKHPEAFPQIKLEKNDWVKDMAAGNPNNIKTEITKKCEEEFKKIDDNRRLRHG